MDLTPVTLEGRYVRLEPLRLSHIPALNTAANDPRITDFYQNILSKLDVKSIMYVAIRVGDDVPAAFSLSV